ncbi:piggyBac transposable element-derived protein 3-like [Hydra vulgaris]|uniref:piggyBac transposable element-derived protein 3-like n=1 Tax=Hydra vulgaris TaxID=6087 RepID=UPI001F5FDDC4|nr:piggyBac transposable element-derived protein 3-like [Hydra vulgaris]
MKPTPNVETTPFEYFKLFVSDYMLNSITNESNINILQSKGSEKNISKKDIEKFIGAYLRMGLVKLPSQRSYWEIFMTYNVVSSLMGRNKFETILQNIHFVNNLEICKEEKADDLVWKLRTWITELRNNFQKVSPEEFHAVDENMVPFKGKSLLRQYLPKKPHKWGFKLLGRSGISGFLYNFDIYQGKSKNNSDTSLGVSADVVIYMTSSLSDKHNFKVFADNYFTSLPLIVELRKRDIYYVGTIRDKRMKKYPLLPIKGFKKLYTHVVAVRWYDNKPVNLVTSYVSIEPLHTVRSYDRSLKKKIDVKQPNIVHVYNQYMGGIDKLDMMCALYKPRLRTRRWYIYIWFHTIQIAVVNAWFLYRRDLKICRPDTKFMQLQCFIAEVAESLIKVTSSRGRPSLDNITQPPKKFARVQGNPSNDVRKDGFDHMPSYNEKRQRCLFSYMYYVIITMSIIDPLPSGYIKVIVYNLLMSKFSLHQRIDHYNSIFGCQKNKFAVSHDIQRRNFPKIKAKICYLSKGHSAKKKKEIDQHILFKRME